jgi:N-acetylglutamate synthase-like GNAT family acetyltransferase
MDTTGQFTVFRAKPADTVAIARFVTRATRGRVSAAPREVMHRFGAKGLWLVSDADANVVGLAGWRAENLIARVDDFLIYPSGLYTSAGTRLLQTIEGAAQELQCEVVVVFVPIRASSTLVDFIESQGYVRPEPEGLPRVWQETVNEASERGRYIVMKKLREDLVLQPI